MRTGPPGDAEQEALDVPRVTEVAGGDCLLDDGAVPQGRDPTRGGGGVVHQATRARLASKWSLDFVYKDNLSPYVLSIPPKYIIYFSPLD